MKNRQSVQYTIRDVPERLDRRVRELAAEYGTSLNRAALDVLAKGAGLSGERVRHGDLDDLAGTWEPDDDFDRALEAMDRIDPELWS